MEEAGYLYVSNEGRTTDGGNVYFDALRINHKKGHIIQEDHYYPFGATINALSSKAPLSKPNRYKFNGGVELNSDFDWNIYETHFRGYDASLGRFMQIDPLADFFPDWNPYQFAYNDPIYWNDPMGLMNGKNGTGDEDEFQRDDFNYDITTRYVDDKTGKLIEDIDDGIDQTVKVGGDQFDYMKEKAASMGLDLTNQSDAFVFAMLYERWSEVPGTSIRFSVTNEDPNFNANDKKYFHIETININKETQELTLTWTGSAPVKLPTSSVISTGAVDSHTPNGEFKVTWRSPNKSSNMSLNTYPSATFAVKFVGHVATHFYPSVPSYPASHGCARIQTESFAGMIWTFSQVGITNVVVQGIWPGHKKKD